MLTRRHSRRLTIAMLAVACIAICSLFCSASIEKAYAASSSGTCGKSATYTYSNNTLTISGTGAANETFKPYLDTSYIKNIVVNEGITSFELAVGTHMLQSVKLPNSLEKIGARVFNNCYNLTTINLGPKLSVVGESAFSGCDKLTTLTLPDSLQRIESCAFYNCEGLTSVKFGANSKLTTIGERAFGDCPKLSSISFPNSLKTIGQNAFYECKALKTLTFPNSLESIDSGAFRYCTGLTSANFGTSSKLTSIGANAFYGCNELTSVNFGTSSKPVSIGESAFSDCAKLSSISFPSSLKTIGPKAFYKNSALKTLALPDSLEKIDEYAFYNCAGLTSVACGANSKLTSIGKDAFFGCKALQTAKLGNSLTIIGEMAFSGCTALKTLDLGKKLTTVEGYAFSECSSLTSLVFPGTINTLGSFAFRGCTSLKTVEFLGNPPAEGNSHCFSDMSGTIIYPANNSKWNAEARKRFNSTNITLQERQSNGGLKAAPYDPLASAEDTLTVPFGSSAGTRIGTFSNWFPIMSKCFVVNVPKDEMVTLDFYYTLPCYHGHYTATVKDSNGNTILSPLLLRTTDEVSHGYAQTHNLNLKKGTYYVEVLYGQSHDYKFGYFSVGAKAYGASSAPKAVAISKLTKGKKSFTVKWKKPSSSQLKKITGYQVRYSTAKSMKGAKTKTVKATSKNGKKCTLKVSKLKGGKKYYVQVRTYKKAGGKTTYSKWSKTKTVKVSK